MTLSIYLLILSQSGLTQVVPKRPLHHHCAVNCLACYQLVPCSLAWRLYKPKYETKPIQYMSCLPARQKGGGRWDKIFFVWFVIGLFETLICAIVEDQVCDSCIVSSWALFIFLLCLWWPKSFVVGLFETLICAIAEDKVCDSCIVSSWALLIFLLCLWWPNSNFLCCVVTQNGESSRDLLLSPRAPFKTLITLLPVTFSQLDPQLGVGWGKWLVLWYVFF